MRRSSALMSSERVRRRVSESLLAKIEDQLGKRGSLSLESGKDLGTNDGNEDEEPSNIEEEPVREEYSTPGETGIESSKIAESDDDVLTASQERVGSGTESPESTMGGVSAFGRRPSLLALAGRISEVSSELGRAPEVRRRSMAPDSMRWDRRGSSRVVTVDHDDLTRRIKRSTPALATCRYSTAFRGDERGVWYWTASRATGRSQGGIEGAGLA